MNSLVTGEAVELDVRPASLGARALSCLIDYLVYFAFYLAFIIGLSWAFGRAFELNGLLFMSLYIITIVFVLVVVPMSVETLTRGRSLGKLALGLRIVRDDGGAIGIRQAFIRSMLWQFEVLGTSGGVAAFCGLLSPQSKRLGDYLAGTIAVNERAMLPMSQAIFAPPRLLPWLSGADISALPRGLHQRIVQFLSSATQRTAESRRERAIELAEELNPYVAPAPPAGTYPEEFLAAVIAYHRNTYAHKLNRTEHVAAAFKNRVGILGHGLHLAPATHQDGGHAAGPAAGQTGRHDAGQQQYSTYSGRS